jgi:hypothetical protein
MSLADVTGKASGLPNRYILHGCEGVGKTSFAAHAPSPIFIQTRGETGLDTLIDAGRLPETPHFPACQTWDELLGVIATLIESDHQYKTLVIDTLNGGQNLCFDEVTRRDFKNEPGEKGFLGYGRGPEVATTDWRNLLATLDELREKRRMAILCLCHTRVKPFRNPEGADYDRFAPDMHEKIWGQSHKWADAVLFMNFETFVDQPDKAKKGKATSSQMRLLYTERHAAYDAKNRMGLPPEIEMGASGQESWNIFKAALIAGRNRKEGE